MQSLDRELSFPLSANLGEATLPNPFEAPETLERRETPPPRLIGRLVSLNGTHGVIDCRLDPGGEDWTVGHLVTIVRENARLVGVVCGLATVAQTWSEDEPNPARATFELHGELVEGAPGRPTFHRGVRSYPSLGANVHRMRADDLRAIYTFRGRQGVEIGRLSQNGKIPAEISIDALIARHFAVLGTTGVGKTTAVSLLIARAIASRPNLRVLILDPHNEYASHFPDQACVIESDALELPIWMFRFDELSDIVFGGRPPHPEEREALYEIIRSAKSRHLAQQGGSPAPGVMRRSMHTEGPCVTPDMPSPFRMADAIAIIDDWMGKLEQRYARADLRALRARLDGLSRDPRYRFMFSRAGVEDDIAKVVSKLFRIPTEGLPVTIVRLAGLPNEVTNSVVSVLARLAFEIAFSCSGRYEVAVLCEEAHRYIPSGGENAFEPACQAIRRIAKEGRKYGASLGVVSPRPSELDPTVLSQCSTTFAMRLANEIDKRIIREAVGASAQSMVELLPSIADREAIAFGEAVAMPMRMKFCDWTGRSQERRVSVLDATPIDLATLANQLRGGGRDPRSQTS
jgi:uncharacterized protein